jgi:hypothetical protein
MNEIVDAGVQVGDEAMDVQAPRTFGDRLGDRDKSGWGNIM